MRKHTKAKLHITGLNALYKIIIFKEMHKRSYKYETKILLINNMQCLNPHEKNLNIVYTQFRKRMLGLGFLNYNCKELQKIIYEFFLKNKWYRRP